MSAPRAVTADVNRSRRRLRFTTADGAAGGAGDDPFAATLPEIVVGQGEGDESSDDDGSDGEVVSDATPDDFDRSGSVVAQNDDGGPPRVPRRRPGSSRERTSVLKSLGRWLSKHGGLIGRILTAGSWVWDHKEEIQSYRDEPKTLRELQDAAMEPPRKGYQNHHIVEQEAARRDGYSGEMIDGRDNVVRIPTLRHYEISGWYGRSNRDFGGKSPREYLRGKPWSERARIGHEVLVKQGVLKP